ncbi:putative cullin protein, neddylation [Helianthus annuus]|uniref:Cullin protein, neddylation n=1 Tax=Helianthus annuus TaxID=4232 RepID=A0A251S831_HELAN|nr:cullin-3A [Helianthus annuus]KAF5764221.1 putative cullin protein, neddylation [Helianthus annuus]KAJ0450928.1 putative cullin protein, neddylation [Helianthus annuus]KAJ0455274.1 putative cullin protein, neddylation [Helianthus annuus]KAJ0844387.1 putative cullin protein, neddylation [Helianthus annuus]
MNNSNQKKRNFQIEAFKHKVVVDPKYADKTWRLLEHAIDEIYNQNASGLSFEELYRCAYNMVLHKYGEKLYTGLVSTMTSHLVTMSRCIENAHGETFLDELNNKWTDHNKALQMIRDILMYMDRSYVPGSHKTPVHALGLNLWRDNVIHLTGIQTRLQNSLLQLIHKERTGHVINHGMMRNIIKMLSDLGPSVYQVDFERPFLEASGDFYRIESREFIEICDCGDYLQKAERRLNEEIDRVERYLSPRSEVKITNVVEKEMIANHMTRLVHMEDSGLVNMIVDDKYEDLKRMYKLFQRVPNGLSTIREVMTSHSRETGMQLVTDPEKLKDPVDFVQCLLNKKDKYDKIISSAFNNDKSFVNALNSSFEFFINRSARSPEFISLFVDDKLRKGLKGVGEEDVEVVLDKVMMMFRYLHEKDVFEKYYKQHLAKRLLSGKDVSDDAERSLVLKLKTECGYQFTSKLEGMFTDMKTSQDTNDGFYANHGADLGDGPSLAVQVLTTGSWPTQPIATCNLPTELTSLCDKFRSYYLGTHSGRRLSWQTNMGTADIKANFGTGQKHELTVSTYQMCVLMLFNNNDQLTYKELEQATEIPTLDLKRCLQSMACVKGKNVLKKEPMSKDVGEDDVFSVNEKFTSKFYKVRIGTVVAQKETEPEKHETRQRVEEDRKPQIEAAIVRIMKARRVLDHNNVIAEVIKQLQSRFLANPSEIKKRIESLIERDFLERDGSDRKLYQYLA